MQGQIFIWELNHATKLLEDRIIIFEKTCPHVKVTNLILSRDKDNKPIITMVTIPK